MIGFTCKTSFDTAAIKKRIDAAQPGALGKAGSFIWRRAKSSLRVRKTVSAPGGPPSVHGDSPLRRLTQFAVNRGKGYVVIGPAAFKAAAAPTIEFGGNERLETKRGTSIEADYKARPWMGPALKAEVQAGTIPSAWSGSIKP